MTNAMLSARLDVLSVALQEVCRALAPAQAAQIAHALRDRVEAVAGGSLAPALDEAVTLELAPLLGALRSAGR
jgi:hypothetical protein